MFLMGQYNIKGEKPCLEGRLPLLYLQVMSDGLAGRGGVEGGEGILVANPNSRLPLRPAQSLSP